MAALTASRNTKQWGDHAVMELRPMPVAANTIIYAGSMVANNGVGYAVPASAATGLKVIGVADKDYNNSTTLPANQGGTGGAAGALMCNVRRGTFKFANNSGDLITQAVADTLCYAVDDNTVGISATGRSPAGSVVAVDADGGVWVEIGIRANGSY